MWPFTRTLPKPAAVSTQMRSEIMGRVHASNVASIADMHISARNGEDFEKALDRVGQKLGIDPVLNAALAKRRKAMSDEVEEDRPGARKVLKGIVGQLERADLTINIKPLSWFINDSRVKARGPESFWAHTGQKSGYATRREQVENELFQYDGAVVPNTEQFEAVAAGIKKHGSPALKKDKVTNPDFAASSRPVYSALNWLSLQEGGAYKYGHVVVVLHQYIKHKATFLHNDTFHEGVADPKKLANHFNYYPLIINCDDKVLAALMAPDQASSRAVAREEYIDAQIHTQVLFNRDVKAIYFMKKSFIDNKNLGGADVFKKVKPNFEKFCSNNGIKPTYVD